MTLKCLECGHIFEDGEQDVRVENHPYGSTTVPERFYVCPICGGDYEETKSCQICGGEFLEEELFGGHYCNECLRKLMTINSFRDFATTGAKSYDAVDTMEDFVFTKVFGLPKGPSESTASLKAWCLTIFESMKLNSELLEKAIFEYMDSFPNSSWEEFADYLYEKEAKK
jgi:DNA-directed RNA polymerase subunit RPC12/RpoP